MNNTVIENMSFDEERALYRSHGVTLINCTFAGDADGESALKESRDISVRDCLFRLRYPFWHDDNVSIENCTMADTCRAALWYSDNITVSSSKLYGIKGLRECSSVSFTDCDIISAEFGWSSRGVKMTDTSVQSEYFMLRAEDIEFRRVHLTGKYSFQYVKNAVIEECIFDTKDAFWHCSNVIVRNSVINGEYLGWYSKGLVFENCTINGTQPLCWCDSLRLSGCRMNNADLSFENSDVDAVLTDGIISIKNPRSGRITVPIADEIIRDDENSRAEIIIGQSAV
ncbi:MAG: DUF3737 family protein [Oscillospiraceae bacterium]|nr:DUF3737 family protein [Oscillospiraceae bacterium]